MVDVHTIPELPTQHFVSDVGVPSDCRVVSVRLGSERKEEHRDGVQPVSRCKMQGGDTAVEHRVHLGPVVKQRLDRGLPPRLDGIVQSRAPPELSFASR